ncbi:hypothetical protein ACSBR2_017249 [Camellia fascicularis]
MQRANGARGGWIPVIKQRARQLRSNSRLADQRASLFTLFVDNLPESMVPRKLHGLFNKFGVAKDVFIPHKRRKATNTRFGFIRYDCSIAADVAEQKANGLWVDDKSLSVKVAEYSKGRVAGHRKNLLPPRVFEPLKEPISEEVSISSSGLKSDDTAKEACSNINGGLHLPAEPRLVREDTNKAVDVDLLSHVDDDKADEGSSLSYVSVVEETRDCAGFSNEIGVGVVESSLPVGSQHQGQCNHDIQNGVEAPIVGNTQQPVWGTHVVQNGALTLAVHVHNLTPGFLKSLSPPIKDRPGIQLEITLGYKSIGPLPIGPSSSGLKSSSVRPICATSWVGSQSKLSASSSPTLSSSNTQRLKRCRRKGSRREGLQHCLLGGKFSGFTRRIVQKGATSNKGLAKSSRSGAADPPVLIHSPVFQQSSDHGSVQEAQSILQMGQRLGIEFKGQESEVIRELVQMEDRDKVRLERGKGIME